MEEHLRALACDDEGMARQLAMHGRQTILARHTCAHRVDELLEICAELGIQYGTGSRRCPCLKRCDIAFFGSSLVSAYWNGAATYYRGIIRALAERGHRITFYEPDAYDRQEHRDIADPPMGARGGLLRPRARSDACRDAGARRGTRTWS